MKLSTKSSCTKCRNCIEKCPKTDSFQLLNCKHCEEPECVKACPENAFKEVMEGVYAVDEEKCTGCGKCSDACPWNAIVIEDEKAKKCDLCKGSPECIKACPINALVLEKTFEEKETLENIFGWKKTRGEYKSSHYEPTAAEARFLQRVREVHQEWVKEEDIDLLSVLEECSREENVSLGKKQKQKLLDVLEKEVKGASVLESLLEDNKIEEIAVTGCDQPIKIFHSHKGWLDTNLQFTKNKKIKELINKIGQKLGRRITLQDPRMNAVMEDGSRLHAAIPPVAKNPSITIRKFNKTLFTPKHLIDFNTVNAELLAFLWIAIQANQNTLVIGSTGSGKTTTLNALTTFIPRKERLILVEETPELRVMHEHCIRLTSNKERDIQMNSLVNDTLRMRPDRVIVSEVRTEKEVKALLNTMLAGQGKNSFSTFHANNAKQALTRLQKLGIKKADLESIDVIISQERWENPEEGLKEKRKVTEVTEVLPGLETHEVFNFDYRNNDWKKTKSKLVAKESKKFLDSFSEELEKRRKVVERSSKEFGKAMEEFDEFC